MKFEMNLKIEKPRYFTVSDITYAQVDAWFGHTTRDLKLDLIYPKLKNKKYPCIVWLCGGGWIRLDKSAHFAYLAKLALEGFAVASVEYRTSNEGAYPMPLEDVKAAIRYIAQHPTLAFELLEILANRIRLLSSQLDSMTFMQADARIAGLLLESEHNGIVAITHEEIANTVGVSRVTVSKTLSRFAKSGYISTEYRRILIKSREGLEKLVNES